jgi:hypothetical protein
MKCRVSALLVASLAVPARRSTAQSQAITGVFEGRVADSRERSWRRPGALTNTATGYTATTTDDSGRYRALLLPGPTLTARSFATRARRRPRRRADRASRPRLQISAVSEIVSPVRAAGQTSRTEVRRDSRSRPSPAQQRPQLLDLTSSLTSPSSRGPTATS